MEGDSWVTSRVRCKPERNEHVPRLVEEHAASDSLLLLLLLPQTGRDAVLSVLKFCRTCPIFQNSS